MKDRTLTFRPLSALCLGAALVTLTASIPARAESESRTFTVNAGPIWNNDHAQRRCPELLQQWRDRHPGQRVRWTGHWWTTGMDSVCQFKREKRRRAITIWEEED